MHVETFNPRWVAYIIKNDLNVFKTIRYYFLNYRLGFLFFGRAKVFISKSAEILFANQAKLFFNKPMDSPEPLAGFLKLYSNSKLEIENDFAIHSGAHLIVCTNAKLQLGGVYKQKLQNKMLQ